MTYYSDNYATIELDEAIPCIKTTFSGIPRHSDHYRAVQRKRIELIRTQKNKPIQLLTDSRKGGLIIPSDIEFFKQRVLPALAKEGVRYFAVVKPEGLIAKMVFEEMVINPPDGMITAAFSSEEEAKAWLKSRQN